MSETSIGVLALEPLPAIPPSRSAPPLLSPPTQAPQGALLARAPSLPPTLLPLLTPLPSVAQFPVADSSLRLFVDG